MTWIFQGPDESRCKDDMGLRWVEMKQRDTSRYQELVLWIQEGWERCGFILSHFSSSNFADRLCFRQKIYYWKFFKIQNKISQLLSLHMSVSEQYSFFFFFFFWQNLPTQSSSWAQKICVNWDSKENALILHTKKRYQNRLGQQLHSLAYGLLKYI